MKKGQITIKDIASELGISVSTVSRALADNPLVKPETKEAVKELAKKYNYHPNFTALSLRNNKTKTLGIIIPQLVHEFFSLVIRGIEDYAYSTGYSVIICSTHESYEREVMDTRTLLTGRVDGLLACVSHETRNFEHFEEVHERGIPLVFFDRICDVVPSHKVVIDDFQAGLQAASHLISIGCRKIAFVGGPKNLQINKDRAAGYRKALTDASLPLKESWVIHSDAEDFEGGVQNTRELIKSYEIDGLFGATDMLAIGAMKNIKQAGLKIPEDIAVVGFSNWSISAIYEPSLSTITQPGYEMGKKSAELLIREIENQSSENYELIVLKTDLIQRDSTKK